MQKDNDRLKRDSELGRSLGDAEMLAKLDSMIQKAQAGQPIGENMADPLERKLATLQKTVDHDRRQAERDSKKLRDENNRLQEKLANLSAALADEARVRVSGFNWRIFPTCRQSFQKAADDPFTSADYHVL